MLTLLVSLALLLTPNSHVDNGHHYGWRNKGPLAPPPSPPAVQVASPWAGGGGGGQSAPSPDLPGARRIAE